jgi:hypothetical protein
MPAETPPIARTIKGQQEATGLGKTKLYELINRGELPVVMIDKRTLILDDDMRACLERHREFRGPNGAQPALPDAEPLAQASAAPDDEPLPTRASPPRAPRRRGRPSKSVARSPPMRSA